MARIRSIKPEFPQSESMGRVSRDARLLFILLWTLADDEGRLRGSSRIVASLLYPYDDLPLSVLERWLGELSAEGCLVQYVEAGSTYIQITNWATHQRIDRPTKSKLPPIGPTSRVLASPREHSRALDEGSSEEGKGREGNGEEGKGAEEDRKPSRAIDESSRAFDEESARARERISSDEAERLDLLGPPPEDPPPDVLTGLRAARVCRVLRQEHRIPDAVPHHPVLRALIEEGAEIEEFVDAAPRAAGMSKPFAYLLHTVAGRRRDAAAQQTGLSGPLPPRETAAQREARERVERVAPGIAARRNAPATEIDLGDHDVAATAGR